LCHKITKTRKNKKELMLRKIDSWLVVAIENPKY
jgi:hypothetical protein